MKRLVWSIAVLVVIQVLFPLLSGLEDAVPGFDLGTPWDKI